MTYSGDDVWVTACQRIGVVSIVSGLVHLFICGKKQVPWHDVFKKSTLIKSTIFLLLIFVAILKGVAFKYAANPAYVSCLLYTSFLWITILPHFIPVFKFKNACNQVYHRKWEYLFIFFVILLILSTQT